MSDVITASRRASVSTMSSSAGETFSVRGLVTDAVTRRGIVGLLVTAYDVRLDDPSGGCGRALAALLATAGRLGSVLTNDDGSFVLEYTKEDIVPLGTKLRPDLLLTLSAPDDDASSSSEKVIWHSDPPRMNAGRTEQFNVALSRETLRKFGLDVEVDVEKELARYERERVEGRVFDEGVVAFHRASVETDIAEKEAIREQLHAAIATRAEAIATTGEIVLEGQAIREKVTTVAARAVDEAQARIEENRGVPVNLFLTADDLRDLEPFFANAVDGFATIPEHALRDILFRRNSSESPGTLLVHQNPIAKFCSERTFEEKCAREHTGLDAAGHEHEDEGGEGEDGADDGGGNGTADEEATVGTEDLPRYVARLVDRAPPPDDVLSPQSGRRADRAAIEEAVDQFSLRTGPAEVPAFYDFHVLQVAFEHVWKVLLDEEIVSSAHALNKKYKSKTGAGLAAAFPRNWTDLVASAGLYETVPQSVPADVAAQFDISLQEWTDLSSTHQQKLKDIAERIATVCEPKVGMSWLGRPVVIRPSLDCERERQRLREQGERLIDGVRHDDYFTMHKTLRDLTDRLNSKYEFTVFAADKSAHSVNFGLLNTFRQQWTPINYQAGQLVKTIPLAPKEERKYSLKVSRTLKHARKEALKNNSSLSNEQSSTSRVESEIMEKAQNKTSFNLSAEGTYNIGISKGKSTTTFGVEAQQESSAARKDFREAVLKAAQEYKEERAVEVTSEDTDTFEATESGTIVNPNDELAVTFLFYELQRKYRIEEQLYRTLPVVLVAQEVPAPHQITESWVIAHDWIINRFLLDDSYRPALTYLANKSVGDDFALRELRKNLRQQRNLVESLQIELSVASTEADNRYRALETAIQKRIGEESAEKTDGWFSDVGDFFGGGGQNPEAAKARELAAKDAHQYAVEKGEKAAAGLRQEVSNLHALTREYNETLRMHLDNETRVRRLLVHIRNNIFYYMQAIWSLEPPDQRYLRLHKVQVPVLELARVPDPEDATRTLPDRTYRVSVLASDDIFESFREPGTTKHRAFLSGRLAPIERYRALVEVADLDSPLGFKGNYMIFPLKEHNALTEFMAAPYVDAAFGAMDPDELSNVSLNDYARYVCCLHERLSAQDFERMKPQLEKWLELLLADPLRQGDEIVVPTGSLFIEALPGAHPLLEDFKLRHRAIDVFKAIADVRKSELGNLRLAARILGDELDDPEIDKKIVVHGAIQPGVDLDNP